ncbi:MAG: PqiC family protein [Puniceicoccales bacterium]|nr:PqiC family protein [Puniceicoccales bacterium]
MSLLFLPGCLVTPVKDTSKFYALGLHSLSEESSSKGHEIPEKLPIKIDLQVTSLPSYLRKSQLMIQLSEHEVQFDEFHRWAEPLEEGLMRIILPPLRNAIAEAYQHPISVPENILPHEDFSKLPSTSPKILKVTLSVEELKVDISRQDIIFQGEVSISSKKKDEVSYRLTKQESSHRLIVAEKLSDVLTASSISWGKVVEAMEGVLKNVGNRIANLCAQHVGQNNL